MQITVKSVKVLKTGTNKQGEWELIGVTSEDGSDYATFDKKAKHLTNGSVIDIGEPIIKEGKVSFKEFTVVSAPLPVEKHNGKSEMSPEMWAEKDRIERQSIESQVAVKTVAELVIAGKLSETSPEYKSMLVWCRTRIKPLVPLPEPPPVSPTLPPEGIAPPSDNQIHGGELITPDQIDSLKKLAADNNMTLAKLGSYCNKDKQWHISKLSDLTREQYLELKKAFQKGEEG